MIICKLTNPAWHNSTLESPLQRAIRDSSSQSGGGQQQGLTRGTRRAEARRPSRWATSHCSSTGKPHLSIQRMPAQICQGPRRCAVLPDLGRLVEFAEATGADHPPWMSSERADLPSHVLSGVPQPSAAGRPSLRWSWRRGRASRLGRNLAEGGGVRGTGGHGGTLTANAVMGGGLAGPSRRCGTRSSAGACARDPSLSETR